MHGSLHSESALGIAVTTDDQDELNSARKCVEDGDFTRARSILEPALQDARGAFDAQAKRLVELMLLYESAVAETSNVADARNLAALEVCHEAAQVSAVAHVGMEASVATINSASARHVTEGSWKTYVELLRHLIKTVGYAKRTDFDVGWLQEQVVLVLLSAQDVAGALAEAESWTFWPLDIEARCPLVLDGLETFPPQIAGGSTLQALLLAVRLAGRRLQDFRARGGRIEYPGREGDEVDLEALFGSLPAE